jgi:hypothetical protein
MMMRSSALLVALCLAGPAAAQPQPSDNVIWSMPGSTCTWDQAASGDSSPLKVGPASVQHKALAKGVIALNCPIPSYGGFVGGDDPWVLALTYQDSTGGAPQGSLKAELYRLSLFGSAPGDRRAPSVLQGGPGVPELIATANSDEERNRASAAEGTSIRTARGFFNHTFDFNNYTYWVHVELKRSGGSQTVVFHSVWLQEDQFSCSGAGGTSSQVCCNASGQVASAC